jgi:23S rRNA pseudouridine955/2504/2580 synthase
LIQVTESLKRSRASLDVSARRRRKLYFKMNELGERVRKSPDRRPARALSAGREAAVPEVRPGGRPAVLFHADRVAQIEIAGDDAGQRLDNFLFRRAKGVPKSHVYRVIRGGEVRVNRKRVDADYRLVEGDVLRVPPMRVAERTQRDEGAAKRERATAFEVIFEDDDLLVIDKPAGIAVHGGSGISFGVIEQLRAARPDARVLELVHRIDRETSGLLMVAKKRSALVKLHDDLRESLVKKSYLALASGSWPEVKRQVKLPLVKFTLPNGERRVRVATRDESDAMSAHTIFRRVENFDGADGPFALVDIELKTGRTHQIRVHLAHIGRPIVGDDKYGDFALNKRVARPDATTGPGLKRMFLHAARLQFVHPRSGEAIDLVAPLPAECARFVERLRRSSAPAP